ncbi:Os08g0471300, partial [Oryza sativa Japonica Group]
SAVCISCQLQDQTDWHARISSIFRPTLELSRSPRPVCVFRINRHPSRPPTRASAASSLTCALCHRPPTPLFTGTGSPATGRLKRPCSGEETRGGRRMRRSEDRWRG